MGLTKYYRVRLSEGHTAETDQVTLGGYLALPDGSVGEYVRGEAVRKADDFKGTIEFAYAEDSESALFWKQVERLREFAERKKAEVTSDDDWFQFESFADVNIWRDEYNTVQVTAYPLVLTEDGLADQTNTNHGINIW